MSQMFISDVTFPTSIADISGASSFLPCGFYKPIDIYIYTQEDGVTRLQYVSTCLLGMWLPRGQDPETLSALLMRCLNESAGYIKI